MLSFKKQNKNAAQIILYFLLFISIVVLQRKYDGIVHPEIIYGGEIKKYVLPSSFVSNFSFGFKNILADMYWISIIQDLPGWNHKDSFYIQEYKNLVTLDPKFSYPYLFGVLTVSTKLHPGSTEMIEPIANIGIQSLPYNWEIPYYLGVQFNLIKNYDKALHYIEIAATRPIIPDVVRSVYRAYAKKTLTGDAASRAFIKTIYDTTESKTTKKIIEEGMVISDMTQIVKNVSEKYKIKYGKYPSSFQELINKEMIRVTPGLQEEFRVTINQNTGEVEITPKNY